MNKQKNEGKENSRVECNLIDFLKNEIKIATLREINFCCFKPQKEIDR